MPPAAICATSLCLTQLCILYCYPPTATHAILLCPTQLRMPYYHPPLWPHVLYYCTSYSHMHHIAAPHPAACATSPPPLMATCTMLLPSCSHMCHVAALLQLYMPCCCSPAATCAMLLLSHSCTCHVATPHLAMCATLVPLLWGHIHYIIAPFMAICTMLLHPLHYVIIMVLCQGYRGPSGLKHMEVTD
jgi:hypothetical protein